MWSNKCGGFSYCRRLRQGLSGGLLIVQMLVRSYELCSQEVSATGLNSAVWYFLLCCRCAHKRKFAKRENNALQELNTGPFDLLPQYERTCAPPAPGKTTATAHAGNNLMLCVEWCW